MPIELEKQNERGKELYEPGRERTGVMGNDSPVSLDIGALRR
jgi:hypothetical protein